MTIIKQRMKSVARFIMLNISGGSANDSICLLISTIRTRVSNPNAVVFNLSASIKEHTSVQWLNASLANHY
jgi:hypothetical protein